MSADGAANRQVQPEAIALRLVYEDADVLVIDKPAGLGGASGRRQSAAIPCKTRLLGLDPSLGGAAARRPHPSPGQGHQRPAGGGAHAGGADLAHRDSSMARTMAREYVAVCVGVMTGGGTIDEPIGRHRSDRLRMAMRERRAGRR